MFERVEGETVAQEPTSSVRDCLKGDEVEWVGAWMGLDDGVSHVDSDELGLVYRVDWLATLRMLRKVLGRTQYAGILPA